MSSADLTDWIALNLLPTGSLQKQRALQVCGDPGEVAFRVPASVLCGTGARGGRGRRAVEACRAGLRRAAERERRRAERLGLRVLVGTDPDFPDAYRTLPDPPVLLYLRGRLRSGRVRVALVGSRRSTRYGRRVAAGLAASLAARGVEVVSGGARGIDTCAHRGAMEGGGTTIAVLGSGFLRPYPPENGELFDAIAEGGALISEFPLDQAPYKGNFPQRNRLISGLAAAVVVVEAAARSGSLVTAGHALEQGREVLAVPGPVTSETSEGCHRLIQEGAKLVQHSEDILAELSPMYRGAVEPGPGGGTGEAPLDEAGLPPDERAVLGFFDGTEGIEVDELAERVPFGIGRLQAALFGLTLRGAVDRSGGRYYLCRPRREP